MTPSLKALLPGLLEQAVFEVPQLGSVLRGPQPAPVLAALVAPRLEGALRFHGVPVKVTADGCLLLVNEPHAGASGTRWPGHEGATVLVQVRRWGAPQGDLDTPRDLGPCEGPMVALLLWRPRETTTSAQGHAPRPAIGRAAISVGAFREVPGNGEARLVVWTLDEGVDPWGLLLSLPDLVFVLLSALS